MLSPRQKLGIATRIKKRLPQSYRAKNPKDQGLADLLHDGIVENEIIFVIGECEGAVRECALK